MNLTVAGQKNFLHRSLRRGEDGGILIAERLYHEMTLKKRNKTVIMKNMKIKNCKFDFKVNDLTSEHNKYHVSKYIFKYLKVVPEEDLRGIENINIYDDTPSHFPKHMSGGYYSPNTVSRGAEIDLFLNHMLGYMTQVAEKNTLLNRLSNKIFLMLFGKLFIANTLFHEIGHHKYNVISPKAYKTEADAEKDAKNYADNLLEKIYPLLPRHYTILNKLYKDLCRKRIERYEAIKSNIPAYGAAYFNNMGKLYLKQQEYEKAIAEFDKLIDRDPGYSNAYLNRGLAKGYLNKYDDAIADFSSAISVAPYDSIAYFNRGFCYHSIAEYEKAIDDYTRAIELNYPHFDVYLNRSRCYEAIKDKERAGRDLQEAIKRGFKEDQIE